jgi:fatty acid desaturase
MQENNYKYELDLEKSLRKQKWLLPLITILTATTLYFLVVVCAHFFNLGQYWTIIPAAFLAHAFFIIILHDGSHKSITRTKADRFIMNLGASLMFLPFYGELFRKFHLIHHGNTNSNLDPLWPSAKTELYNNKRWFYVLCELVPILFSIYSIIMSKKENTTNKKVKGPKVELKYILMGSLISLAVILIFIPNIWFLLFTFLVLNFIGKIRHWCEHMGVDNSVESNTFSFPLGMGVGNHDTHHHSPHVSWFVLMIGLYNRKKNSSFLKAFTGVFFNKNFTHYH